jgi:PKD repeat protein
MRAPTLNYSTTYYWHVRYQDNTEAWSLWSAETSFTAASTTPEAGFSADITVVVVGQSVQFTNLSTGGIPPLTYAWDFDGDGIIDSTDLNPTHSYAATGSYAVSLKISDSGGNSDTERKAGFIAVGNAVAPQNIPFQGGTAQTGDGNIVAVFPAGAATGEVTTTIEQISPSSAEKAPEGFKLGTSCFTIEAVDGTGKAIVMFSRQVTVTVKYSDEDVAAAGGKPKNLVLAYYNNATGEWNVLETSLNTIDKTLTVTTTHLSTWAILAKTSPGRLASWLWIVIGIVAALGVGVVVVKSIAVGPLGQAPQSA